MPPSTQTNSNKNQMEQYMVIRGCEPCKRRKAPCNGQKPCSHCVEATQNCVYSVISEHPRTVFTTNIARRLSSGSACETCRRRKTKCDGQSPCSFCSNNDIECVNERRKRFLAPSNLSITTTNEDEAIDRINDRLKRIEKLMTAFQPSSKERPNQHIRQQRHSIHTVHHSPPLSPKLMRSSSTSTNISTSMLNLTLSPSSSSTSSSSYAASLNIDSQWKQYPPIPSLMDQLSKCTFVTTAMDFTAVQYPIYPITPPSSKSMNPQP